MVADMEVRKGVRHGGQHGGRHEGGHGGQHGGGHGCNESPSFLSKSFFKTKLTPACASSKLCAKPGGGASRQVWKTPDFSRDFSTLS